jgi:hypothetical protein
MKNVMETYKRMRALDDQWKSGAKIECPEDLSHYLKGIVLNDHAHEAKEKKLKITLTESAIEQVRERLSNAPKEEELYLKLLTYTLMKELDYYTGKGGELMGSMYEVLFNHGAKFYGWK